MTKTDLIIIGAGPGGYRAAEYAAHEGLQAVIIEKDEVGGTCLNRGCIPTKAYVHSASLPEALERKDRVVLQLRSGVEQLMASPGISLMRGTARFTDAHTVEMDNGEVFTAPYIIIATGSLSKMPPVPGIDSDPRVLTSTSLLQQTTLPRRLAVIGAGVIGMEMAGVFQRFGSEVTVIEFLRECLPMLDSDVAKRLRKLMERRGITFCMKTEVKDLAAIDADAILVATGRRPCLPLGWENAGLDADERRGIVVDDNMQTNQVGVYAIGDVNGRQMLAHAAETQALRAVNHILGRPDTIRLDIMPAAIFTQPEAACVGLSEDQCREQGLNYRCRKAFWRANGKAQTMDETEGLLKLISENETGRLLGCHAFGAHASDMVQEVSTLMCMDATVEKLRYMTHIHPTLSEVLLAAAWQ